VSKCWTCERCRGGQCAWVDRGERIWAEATYRKSGDGLDLYVVTECAYYAERKTEKARTMAPLTPEEEGLVKKAQAGLTPGLVAELVLMGWTQSRIAEESPSSLSAVSRLVAQAVDEGLLAREGFGKYRAPDGR